MFLVTNRMLPGNPCPVHRVVRNIPILFIGPGDDGEIDTAHAAGETRSTYVVIATRPSTVFGGCRWSAPVRKTVSDRFAAERLCPDTRSRLTFPVHSSASRLAVSPTITRFSPTAGTRFLWILIYLILSGLRKTTPIYLSATVGGPLFPGSLR